MKRAAGAVLYLKPHLATEISRKEQYGCDERRKPV
jgi:hypothetical protein